MSPTLSGLPLIFSSFVAFLAWSSVLLGSPTYAFVSAHSALCAHLYRLGSEWLWGDVHDVHFINGKYWFVKEHFQLSKLNLGHICWFPGPFLTFSYILGCPKQCRGSGCSGLTAKPVPWVLKWAAVPPWVPCTCLWPYSGERRLLTVSREDSIFHGCCPEALQELQLTHDAICRPL